MADLLWTAVEKRDDSFRAALASRNESLTVGPSRDGDRWPSESADLPLRAVWMAGGYALPGCAPSRFSDLPLLFHKERPSPTYPAPFGFHPERGRRIFPVC